MRPPPRKAKSAAKPIIDTLLSDESDTSEEETKASRTGDFFKDVKIEQDALSQDSDFEQEVRKRKGQSTVRPPPVKKIKLNTRKSSQASPEIALMSDDDLEDDREDDLRLFERMKKPLQRGPLGAGVKVTTLPKALRIEVLHAPTTININLADLFPQLIPRSAKGPEMDGTTLLDDASTDLGEAATHKAGPGTPQSFADMRADVEYACFLELEPDLRNRIYRALLVRDEPVKFNPCPDLSRNAAVLRTCRQVHREATDILYGENAFHLDRTSQRRGTLYNATWREIGYKDMRRFIETIGQQNLSKMRFLSLSLVDAAPVFTPDLGVEQRRYYNDPVLIHILKLIGNSGAVLEKFVVSFGGRGALEYDNVPFIRAFTTVKCRKLIKTCCWNHSRISLPLLRDMEKFMKVPAMANVDPDRQKAPTMQNELDVRSYGCNMWSCRSH